MRPRAPAAQQEPQSNRQRDQGSAYIEAVQRKRGGCRFRRVVHKLEEAADVTTQGHVILAVAVIVVRQDNVVYDAHDRAVRRGLSLAR